MKAKPTKTCKECGNTFKPYKTVDRYCSFECAAANTQKPKHYKPINKVSAKMKNELTIYSRKRKVFLSLEENKYCPVAKAAFDGLIDISEMENPEEIKATEGRILTEQVHHKKGRIGNLLNNQKHWLAVSHWGHVWIHTNPEKAHKLNFLSKRLSV